MSDFQDPFEEETRGMFHAVIICLIFWASFIGFLLYGPFSK